MSTIYNSIPSVPNTEDVFEQEQELERELEETQGNESNENVTDQDGSNEGGSSGQSDKDDSGMTSQGAEGVEGVNAEEQETIPSTFFSAMAYSIEAYLAAIEAQQESALANIDLYVGQVQQQFETTKSLASVIREKIKLEADKLMADAAVAFATAGISGVQTYGTYRATKDFTKPFADANRERTNLQSNLDAMKPATSVHGRVPPAKTLSGGLDPVMDARRTAAKTPANNAGQGADQLDAKGNARPLSAKQREEYSRMVKDDINAADHRIAGLQSARQAAITSVQIYAELLKSVAQGAGAAVKSGYENEIAKLEENRTYLETAKDLIGSLIQQIQGRISSASKGSLDGIDSLRQTIRQFQG